MSSLKRHEGYLIVDHSASPGLPADVARQSGYDPRHCGEGRVFEAATLTCSHCKCTVVKNPLRTRDRTYCSKCDHYLCDVCAMATAQADYVHVPFEQLAEAVLRHAEKSAESPIVLLSP